MVNQELKRTELYNIETDWAETTNAAQANPNIVKKMTKKVLAWKTALPTEPPSHCFSKMRKE